jgi:hypothetical protein
VKKPTLRELFEGRSDVRVVAPSPRQDEEFAAFASTKDSTAEDAPTVDGEQFQIYDIPLLEQSGFTHFLDGAQKSWRAMYEGMFPIFLAHTSAALLERRERELAPPDDASYRGGLEAFVPSGADASVKLQGHYDVVSVAVEEGATPLAAQMEIADSISERRDMREDDLARNFRDGVLLVDGALGRALRGRVADAFVVGLVKSHRKQYFKSRERVAKMLGMKAGQRTSVFLRAASAMREEDVYSFYLRLRDAADADPMFGLVRIEIPKRDEMLEMVDTIAAWILHERVPMSLPDPRYDRMLYPTRLVEQHLKARQPSDSAIRGLIGV